MFNIPCFAPRHVKIKSYVASTRILSLFLLVMWIFSLYTCIIIIKFTLSNPMNNSQQVTSDSTDEFYREMEFALKKLQNLNDKEAESETKDGISPGNSPIVSEPVKKSKSDSTTEEALQKTKRTPVIKIFPSKGCEKYLDNLNTCINVRQIGTTLTLGVRLEPEAEYGIRWQRHYTTRDPSTHSELELKRNDVPWNMNIDESGKELSISPITEIDFSYNYFEASVDTKENEEELLPDDGKPLKFFIENINIDMGEELDVIYARAFIELPRSSMTFKWTFGDEELLSSHTKVLADGSAVVAKDLGIHQDKVLICTVYSNKEMFLARRNFLIRKMDRSSQQKHALSTTEVKSKRRRKRSEEENQGFDDNEFEILNRKILSNIQIQAKHYSMDELNNYINNHKRYATTHNPFFLRNEEHEGESLNRLERIPIRSEFFYKENTPNFLNKNFQARENIENVPPLKRTIDHVLPYQDETNHLSFNELKIPNGVNYHYKPRNVIPAEVSDGDFRNSDRNNRDATNFRHDRHSFKSSLPSDTYINNNLPENNKVLRHKIREANQEDSDAELPNSEFSEMFENVNGRRSHGPRSPIDENGRFSSHSGNPSLNFKSSYRSKKTIPEIESRVELPYNSRDDIDSSVTKASAYDVNQIYNHLEKRNDVSKSSYKFRHNSEEQDGGLSNARNYHDFSVAELRSNENSNQNTNLNPRDVFKPRYQYRHEVEERDDSSNDARNHLDSSVGRTRLNELKRDSSRQLENSNDVSKSRYQTRHQAGESHENLPYNSINGYDISAAKVSSDDNSQISNLNPRDIKKPHYKHTSRIEEPDEDSSTSTRNNFQYSRKNARSKNLASSPFENASDGSKRQFQSQDPSKQSGDESSNFRKAVEFFASKARQDYRRSADVRYSSTMSPVKNNELQHFAEESEDGVKDTFDNRESMILADCEKDDDCSNQARCLKYREGKLICQCNTQYRGNGIFCWLV